MSLQLQMDLRGARRDLDTAKADNIALVERLKYVQGYKSQRQGQGECLLQ